MPRNACGALGNVGDQTAVPDLKKVLDDADPVVRGHAAWALGRIGGAGARDALVDRRTLETDASAIVEIEMALNVDERAPGTGDRTESPVTT